MLVAAGIVAVWLAAISPARTPKAIRATMLSPAAAVKMIATTMMEKIPELLTPVKRFIPGDFTLWA
jgi:hypothetical protein